MKNCVFKKILKGIIEDSYFYDDYHNNWLSHHWRYSPPNSYTLRISEGATRALLAQLPFFVIRIITLKRIYLCNRVQPHVLMCLSDTPTSVFSSFSSVLKTAECNITLNKQAMNKQAMNKGGRGVECRASLSLT